MSWSTAKKDQSICWTCKRALPRRGCEWADSFKAVKGWDAEKTVLRNTRKGGGTINSYRVKSCPKYINDKDDREV